MDSATDQAYREIEAFGEEAISNPLIWLGCGRDPDGQPYYSCSNTGGSLDIRFYTSPDFKLSRATGVNTRSGKARAFDVTQTLWAQTLWYTLKPLFISIKPKPQEDSHED